jgi:hypothetical protein
MNLYNNAETLPLLQTWPLPARLLATATILMLGLGLAVAAVQATVHDIIPTFQKMGSEQETGSLIEAPQRGDLLAEITGHENENRPLYKKDEFLFALKFSHIHIFGMSGIFIVMGAIAVFLNQPAKLRIWLIVLPFAGILIDLLGVWLKLFVHPAFFWMHIPGGLMFAVVFIVESVLILRELWRPARSRTEYGDPGPADSV